MSDPSADARPPGSSLDFDVDVDPSLLFSQAMAQTRMAVCLTDPHREDNPIVFVNRAFIELTGYPGAELLGRNCRLLQGPDTDPATIAEMRRAIVEQEVVVVELRNYRKDGTAFWNALHLGPIHDSEGRLQYYFGSQWDVTSLRVAQVEERMSRMFTRELAHRMKNMFAVVAGVVSLCARHEGVPRVAVAINERIAALGRAHEDAFTSELNDHVELGRVARHTLAPYLDSAASRITIRGQKVMLAAATVSLIGLALHELAVNALKHGALSDESGRIEFDWALNGGRSLVLQWRERMSRTPSPPEPATGLGILDDLVTAAGGQLEWRWREDGLSARFELPLDTVLASPAAAPGERGAESAR